MLVRLRADFAQRTRTSWADPHRYIHGSRGHYALPAAVWDGWMDAWFESCLWSSSRQGMGSDGFMCHDMLYSHSAPLGDIGSSPICSTNSNRVIPGLTTSYDSAYFHFCFASLDVFLLNLVCAAPLSTCWLGRRSHYILPQRRGSCPHRTRNFYLEWPLTFLSSVHLSAQTISRSVWIKSSFSQKPPL